MKKQAETPVPETAPQKNRVLAMFDSAGVLVGRNDMPSDEEWDAAHEKQRFPNGFDNAVNRYRIVEHKPGRWRFEAITHALDKGAENTKDESSVIPLLVRCVLQIGNRAPVDTKDFDKLESFLATFDAKGA